MNSASPGEDEQRAAQKFAPSFRERKEKLDKRNVKVNNFNSVIQCLPAGLIHHGLMALRTIIYGGSVHFVT